MTEPVHSLQKPYGIPDRENITLIRRISWIGLATNILLSAVKFLTGILGSSQAIVADAVHSLSDLVTDLAILMGVKYWTAPADADHPYGHRRIEALITLFIGGILFTTALSIGYHALVTIHNQHIKPPALFASAGALLSIIFKEILYQWTRIVGKKTNSLAVIANAWHHRSDAISSIPAFFASAIAALYPGWEFIDHIGALIVILLIIKVSWDIMKPAFGELTDQGLPNETLQKIAAVALKNSQVRDVHAVRTRKHGDGIYIDLHALVDPDLTIEQAHDVSGEIKQSLLNSEFGIVDVIVHIEPYREPAEK